jgi:uncharacterized protein YjbI with pentapeptide repeats
MANDEHVALLKKGVAAWNAWRRENPNVRPDLSEVNLKLRGADLRGANLTKANLAKTDLARADLTEAVLREADLSGAFLHNAKLGGTNFNMAILRGAFLTGALFSSSAKFYMADLRDAILMEVNFRGTNFRKADLSGANLAKADLRWANLSGARLNEANLQAATLLETDLTDVDLTGCRIYGVSAWGLKLEGAKQQNLVTTPENEPEIIVDDLEVAQFIHLLLNREKIRNVIDAVTRRGVLILGRFGDGGLALLQAVAAWLRMPENGGYLPLLFDFPRPDSKTYTETIRTLASLARFVIVDLSGPSVPQEITATVDQYEIPFVPILEGKREDWSMFKDFLVKERVLKPVRFTDQNQLLQLLAKKIIAPAEKLIAKRQQRLDEIFGRA